MTTRSHATPPSAWILGPAADTVFILAAPLLVVALVIPASRVWSPEALWLAVLAFGSVGHHLPGFLRTHGDPELFAAYRLCFLVAPPLVLACTWWLASQSLHTMALVTMVWSIWHGMMQHYGFMRIYDAKIGNTDRLTARLDFAVTVSWFGLALTLSPTQAGSLLDALFTSRLPFLPAEIFQAISWLAIAATASSTGLYVWHAWRQRRAGKRLSPHKLVLLVTTTGLVWFARVMTPNPFVSMALFEVLHDVQYLAIVWGFNRHLVSKGHGRGALQRVLFGKHRSGPLAYVAACAAYGLLAFWHASAGGTGPVHDLLAAVLITSGILHFYYDGFIWKVRQRDTRRGLGLEGDANMRRGSTKRRRKQKSKRATPVSAPASDRRRELIHAAAFIVPVASLAWLEAGEPPSDEGLVRRRIVELVPDSATARENLGRWMLAQGDPDGAAEQLTHAVELSPSQSLDEALAEALAQRGKRHLSAGDAAAGRRDLDRALSLDPDLAIAHYNLGVLLASERDYEGAERHFARAVEAEPTFVEARNSLGGIYAIRGRRELAIETFREVLRQSPNHPRARANLARLGAPE